MIISPPELAPPVHLTVKKKKKKKKRRFHHPENSPEPKEDQGI